MKFEKFVKRVGVHGKIVSNGDEAWLICNGVGMLVPEGVKPFGDVNEPNDLIRAILKADIEDDELSLFRASLPYADSKPSEIVRVFKTELDDEIGIRNENFGLIEKNDRLVYLEIETSENNTEKFILVTDRVGNKIIGFISETLLNY
jgi:hypothetical protein